MKIPIGESFSLIILFSFSFFFPNTANSQSLDSSTMIAGKYFKEAKMISAKDNGKLWGARLYGPMIFVDKNTGRAIANEPDSAGSFIKKNNVYIGDVLKSFASNTARRWGGKIWTVLLWPISENKSDRAYLMMHELFHQLQDRTGLLGFSPVCDHLDKFEGRLLLKLELEALRKVINAYPDFSKTDLSNAIALRRYRYTKFPMADSLEHSLEFNEGLATYTGFVLSELTINQQKLEVNKQIDNFYNNKTFVRSLAYVTGYTYGFLLAHKNMKWTRNLTTEMNLNNSPITYRELKEKASFDDLIVKLYNLDLPPSNSNLLLGISQRNQYNYDSIFAFEKSREENRLAIDAENKRKFIDGPVLELPNERMNFNFNPNEVQVLDGYGPIYPTFTGKAAWGLLQVEKGGALVKDWMYVYVPLPELFDSRQSSIKTADWQLDLKEGWIIVEAKRKGDYKVVKQ